MGNVEQIEMMVFGVETKPLHVLLSGGSGSNTRTQEVDILMSVTYLLAVTASVTPVKTSIQPAANPSLTL